MTTTPEDIARLPATKGDLVNAVVAVICTIDGSECHAIDYAKRTLRLTATDDDLEKAVVQYRSNANIQLTDCIPELNPPQNQDNADQTETN